MLTVEMVMENQKFSHGKSWNLVSKILWESCDRFLDKIEGAPSLLVVYLPCHHGHDTAIEKHKCSVGHTAKTYDWNENTPLTCAQTCLSNHNTCSNLRHGSLQGSMVKSSTGNVLNVQLVGGDM